MQADINGESQNLDVQNTDTTSTKPRQTINTGAGAGWNGGCQHALGRIACLTTKASGENHTSFTRPKAASLTVQVPRPQHQKARKWLVRKHQAVYWAALWAVYGITTAFPEVYAPHQLDPGEANPSIFPPPQEARSSISVIIWHSQSTSTTHHRICRQLHDYTTTDLHSHQ